MNADQIIIEVDGLPLEGKEKVYSHLKQILKNKEIILKSLEEIRGIGKGLWDMDAQEYINQERANDRNG